VTVSNATRLLAIGNGKLGEQIAHFDLPALPTCPGRSSVCESVCYATTGRFVFANVRTRLAWCLRQSRRAGFSRRAAKEIRSRGLMVVRLHVSGDFYDADYARKWLCVMSHLPRVRFYFYTRSWRVPAIASVLEEMARLECCRVWYSVDRDTGCPQVVPTGVRLSYLQDAPGPVGNVGLVFRTSGMLESPRVGLPLICPTDTPVGRRNGTTCGSCGVCFRE
jgi:hypothetical protein